MGRWDVWRPPRKRVRAPVIEQQLLDLGQQLRTECKRCRMVLAAGEQHDKLCDRLQQRSSGTWLAKLHNDNPLLLHLNPIKDSALDSCAVQSVEQRTETVKTDVAQRYISSKQTGVGVGVDVKFLRIRKYGEEEAKQRTLIKRIEEIKRNVVDPVMGFISDQQDDTTQLFIAVNKDGMMCGLAVIERIVSQDFFQIAIESDNKLGERTTEELKDPPVIGVRQIWVAPNCRRQGIASLLLDIVCQHAVYGVHINRSRISFSQPTNQGAGLALAYTGHQESRTLIVYKLLTNQK